MIPGMVKRRLGFLFQLYMQLPCMNLVDHCCFLGECSQVYKMTMIVPFFLSFQNNSKLQKKKKNCSLRPCQYWIQFYGCFVKGGWALSLPSQRAPQTHLSKIQKDQQYLPDNISNAHNCRTYWVIWVIALFLCLFL